MTSADVIETPSGKGAADENFPVGSWLLPRKLRPHVARYYRFARAIDDIADNPELVPNDKVERLNAMADAVSGHEIRHEPGFETASRMYDSLTETNITARHCTDLVDAFRQDAVKGRYANWDELIGYCLRSAAPVGRYLLDLHGEDQRNYRYSDAHDAHVFAGIQLKQSDLADDGLLKRLEGHGYRVLNLTNNEMAKSHIRYMVGGHTNHRVENELVYRFIFPERPGALLRFLTHMNVHWNISLFHYRNHGAAYGRILVGIQVPLEEREEFQTFLDELDYPYWEETNNPAYELFLG